MPSDITNLYSWLLKPSQITPLSSKYVMFDLFVTGTAVSLRELFPKKRSEVGKLGLCQLSDSTAVFTTDTQQISSGTVLGKTDKLSSCPGTAMTNQFRNTERANV